jgi:hypothetical protein
MDEERFKQPCIKGEGKKGRIHQPFRGYSTWVADFVLGQDVGKFMLGKYECQTNFMEAKETFGDGCGRKYANGHSAVQNRQDTISRVSAVQNSARGPR